MALKGLLAFIGTLTLGSRSGADEHDAGFGDAADAGDWSGEGAGARGAT